MRKIRFPVLLNEGERASLEFIAVELGRTKGDTIRFLIGRTAADLLKLRPLPRCQDGAASRVAGQ